MTEELARAAYEAYAGALGIDRTPGGKAWEDLPQDRRRAWLAAVTALAPDPGGLTGFSEVLPAIMAGKRARRAAWAGMSGAAGDWVQRAIPPSPGGPSFEPQIMSWHEKTRSFWLWGGINRDIQQGDWELLEEED